jgi:signal transduction histidine kinase
MMKGWLRGKRGGLVAFLAITALVAGGLGWVTVAALRLEHEQLEAGNQALYYSNLRLALWRLDSLIATALAKEDSRPYDHYSAVYAPPLVLQPDGNPSPPGTVLEPSPLLSAELPDWMLLHFQTDCDSGWRSPQVLSTALADRLQHANVPIPMTNVTPERKQLLAEVARLLKADTLLARVQPPGVRPSLEELTLVPGSNMQPQSANRSGQGGVYAQQMNQSVDPEFRTRYNQAETQQRGQARSLNNDAAIALENTVRNGEDWFSRNRKARRGEQVVVSLGPMVPLWLPAPDGTDRLILARHVQVGKKELCQGILLDWPRLRALLAAEAQKEDLFPMARVQPVQEAFPFHSERAMTVLPLELDPGPVSSEAPAAGWTPLRAGLTLAWAAALVALSAVGLGGWSLIDLSQRRIRFVSAVTHELRTPLTTLRLYLDMLAGGMVKDPQQKEEYLQTLNTEADRLNRLVGNVLDFSRLENQRPRLVRAEVRLGDLLEQILATWQTRCASAGKELVVENSAGCEVVLLTDVQLVQQILGNLIDNACKYSRGAPDRRIWLRVFVNPSRQLVFEVEDQGPGVPARERRSIFRPFRRGPSADVTAGGVGLGLALAQRWAHLLGGRLCLQTGRHNTGACFRLEFRL